MAAGDRVVAPANTPIIRSGVNVHAGQDLRYQKYAFYTRVNSNGPVLFKTRMASEPPKYSWRPLPASLEGIRQILLEMRLPSVYDAAYGGSG
jgi:hypothetical protein